MFTGIAGLLASVLITVGTARRTHSSATSEQDYWAINMLRDNVIDPSGAVLNAGTVQLPNGTNWEREDERPVREVLASTWNARASALAALGHPRRLDLLQRVMTSPAVEVELDQDGKDRTHVAALVRAGWLVYAGTGRHRIPGSRVIPLLAILMAAEDP